MGHRKNWEAFLKKVMGANNLQLRIMPGNFSDEVWAAHHWGSAIFEGKFNIPIKS